MMTLLWIDDDEELVESSIPLFKKYGFEILKATSISRALKILRENADLVNGILLDVRLGPSENGIELLDDLHHRYPEMKIAMFTGFPEYDDHIRSEMSGAAIYLEKVEKSIPLDSEKQKTFFSVLSKVFSNEFKETNQISKVDDKDQFLNSKQHSGVNEILNSIGKILFMFKPDQKKWIVRILVLCGLALLSPPFWQSLLNAFLSQKLDFNPPEAMSIVASHQK